MFQVAVMGQQLISQLKYDLNIAFFGLFLSDLTVKMNITVSTTLRGKLVGVVEPCAVLGMHFNF